VTHRAVVVDLEDGGPRQREQDRVDLAKEDRHDVVVVAAMVDEVASAPVRDGSAGHVHLVDDRLAGFNARPAGSRIGAAVPYTLIANAERTVASSLQASTPQLHCGRY
jgi:hypothetical protein